MAARAISSASLSFGLVNIPVKLYSTSRSRGSGDEKISFHWLHSTCGTRVKQQYYCPKDDQVVGRSEMVRGYEVSKGKYVPVTEEELEETKVATRESIDIVSFVPADTVDVLYLEHSYYLGPDKGGAKGYAVLVEAIQRSGRLAVARYAARGSEHVVTVRPDHGLLVMHQLRYAEEVRPADEIPAEHPRVTEKELELAEKLIEQTAEKAYDPDVFEDEAKSKKKQLIARKLAAGAAVSEEAAGHGRGAHGGGGDGKVIDLMEALKASLGGGRGGGKAAAAATERKPARRSGARARAGARKGRRGASAR